MIIPATIISVVFASLGFLVTKNNARYILSGYNLMWCWLSFRQRIWGLRDIV